MNKRVHQIAKDQGLPAKEVLARLQAAGFEVTAASSSVDEEAAMRALMQSNDVRAGQLSVARNGEIQFERAYTWAEPDYPVTGTDSPIRLASVPGPLPRSAFCNLESRFCVWPGSSEYWLESRNAVASESAHG